MTLYPSELSDELGVLGEQPVFDIFLRLRRLPDSPWNLKDVLGRLFHVFLLAIPLMLAKPFPLEDTMFFSMLYHFAQIADDDLKGQ